MSIKIKDPTTGEWIKQSTGGGGGVSSWNDLPVPLPNSHLPEGYPYAEEGFVALIEEQTLTAGSDGMMAVKKAINLALGETYKVTWNGSAYNCIAVEADLSSLGFGTCPTLGNLAPIGGANTGEPFAMAVVSANNITGFMPLDGSTTATVKVEGKKTVLFEEATVTCSEAAISEVLPLVLGGIYKVKWNGTEYTCVAYEFDATEMGVGVLTVIGNGVNFGLPDTGEPFAIAPLEVGGVTMVLSLDGAETAVVKITEVAGETIHKMDNKFIDAEWMANTSIVKSAFISETVVTYESEDEESAALELENMPEQILKDGQKYYVTFEGSEYTVNSLVLSLGMDAVGVIGNWALLGFNYEERVCPDVPFCIQFQAENGEIYPGVEIVRSEEYRNSLTATIKVEFDETIYNKVPEEFLPEKALKKYYKFPVDLAECYQTDSPTNFTQEAIDGVMKAQEALTNGLLVMGTYQGIPCIVTEALYDTVDGGMHTLEFASFSERITFWNFGTTYYKYGKSELILHSSTENSNKQFKITVDDSGTLTATEIT